MHGWRRCLAWRNKGQLHSDVWLFSDYSGSYCGKGVKQPCITQQNNHAEQSEAEQVHSRTESSRLGAQKQSRKRAQAGVETEEKQSTSQSKTKKKHNSGRVRKNRDETQQWQSSQKQSNQAENRSCKIEYGWVFSGYEGQLCAAG